MNKISIPRQTGKTLFLDNYYTNNVRIQISEYCKRILFSPLVNKNYKIKLINKLLALEENMSIKYKNNVRNFINLQIL